MKITDTKARMTNEDVAVLKAMFEEREGAVEVIRKIFYPELTADAPLHANKDMFFDLNLEGMSAEQKVIAVEARQLLIKHVEGSLQVIKALVGNPGETPEQTMERLKKDSAK